jgi:hypothetical protein
LLCLELQKECEVEEAAEVEEEKEEHQVFSQRRMTFLKKDGKAAEDTGSNGEQTVSLTQLQSSGSTSLAAAATGLSSTTAATKTAEDGRAGRVCGLSSDGTSL